MGRRRCWNLRPIFVIVKLSALLDKDDPSDGVQAEPVGLVSSVWCCFDKLTANGTFYGAIIKIWY